MRAIELARAKCSTRYCVVQSVIELKRAFSVQSDFKLRFLFKSSSPVLANVVCIYTSCTFDTYFLSFMHYNTVEQCRIGNRKDRDINSC